MKFIPAAMVAVGALASGMLSGVPADAQGKGKQAAAAAQPAQWTPKFNKEEVKALQPVQAALKTDDPAAITAAVTAAQAGVTSPDAKYYLGQVLLQVASKSNNQQLQAQAMDAMIASGGGDPTLQAALYRSRGGLALQAKDYARAETAFTRWAQLAPNDPEAQLGLADVKLKQNKPQEALAMTERAIAARQASGQPIPENWYHFALQSALDAKATPKSLALSRTTLGAYPTAKNWRNGILIYRQSVDQDPATRLDTLRLMRATKSLDRSDEYLALADQLSRGGFYAEAQAVLDEGTRAGKVPAASAAPIAQSVSGKIAGDRAALPGLEGRARSGANGSLALRLADGYYGHGNYAKAAEFYRLALQKGGIDAATANTRLGMSLAQAGQKAEAEAAFKSVTGPRADLASYWLIWLNQRG